MWKATFLTATVAVLAAWPQSADAQYYYGRRPVVVGNPYYGSPYYGSYGMYNSSFATVTPFQTVTPPITRLNTVTPSYTPLRTVTPYGVNFQPYYGGSYYGPRYIR